MKVTIVTTTIHVPVALMDYARNARGYGHRNLDFIVIGDRKTPPATGEFCAALADYYPSAYLDIEAQRNYLERFPDLWSHLRFDSIQRRNIGMLLAWERGADIIITIDDDNFVLPTDFVGLHCATGSVRDVLAYGSTSGWFDVCSSLVVEDGVRFYHRGFPWKSRWTEHDHFMARHQAPRRIAVNAGLWLDDPDIDALARMDRQPVVRGIKPGYEAGFALLPGTWSPFNSQNTSLARDVVPAYFLSPCIGRYDDIWASYVVNRIAGHFGDAIAFGAPLVRQQRNPHNLWNDLDNERNGMILTDDFCTALRRIPLTGSTYHECFGEIAAALPSVFEARTEWTESQREWKAKLIQGMEIWHGAFEKLRPREPGPVKGTIRLAPMVELEPGHLIDAEI